MAFIDKIPAYTATLEKEIKHLEYKRLDIDWGHDCDCEYCDQQNDVNPDEAQQEADDIDAQIKEHLSMILKLKNYKALFDKGSRKAGSKT